MSKPTIQDYADDVLAPEYRQTLMTVQEACAKHGWEFAERPKCCGVEAEHNGMFGSSYHVECKTCGKFIADITAPRHPTSGSIAFIDFDKFAPGQIEAPSWFAGIAPRDADMRAQMGGNC